jgi:molybdopterin synthase sulfur carrier subunit
MRVRVSFHSYFKDLAGVSETPVDLPEGGTIHDLLSVLFASRPRLEPMRHSLLIAVGVEYQKPDYRLKDGDEVALFPPVQGG